MSSTKIPEPISQLIEELNGDDSDLEIGPESSATIFFENGKEFTLSGEDCRKLFQSKKTTRAFIQALKECDQDPEECSMELDDIDLDLEVYDLLDDTLLSLG